MDFVFPGFTIVLIVFFILVLQHFVPIGLWISALAAGVHISIFDLIGCAYGACRRA